MKCVPIANITVGDVLTNDVASLQGMTIARKGTAITERHIKAFKAWGITEVHVGDPSDEASDPHAVEPGHAPPPNAVLAELDHLFSKTDREHPALAELLRIATSRSLKSSDDGAKSEA